MYLGERANWFGGSNTAQVYSSLADAILNERDADKELAIQHLNTACEMFNDCFERQQAIYASYSALPTDEEEIDTESGGVSLSEAPEVMANADEDEGYAVIQASITPSTILDTLLELLSTLSVLLPIHPSPQPLIHTVESLLSSKLAPLSTSLPDRQTNCILTAAITKCAIAESLFRTSSPDPNAWEAAISASFNPTEWSFSASADALCAKSDAHVSLASTIPELAWKHYAFASQALGEAAKLEPTKARIYLARGDMELVRSRIECAARTEQVRELLRKNAGVFYRGAMRLEDAEVKKEGEVKEAALRFENGEVAALTGLLDQESREILEEAVEEEVFEAEILEKIITDEGV